jgi:hypothetical protein
MSGGYYPEIPALAQKNKSTALLAKIDSGSQEEGFRCLAEELPGKTRSLYQFASGF